MFSVDMTLDRKTQNPSAWALASSRFNSNLSIEHPKGMINCSQFDGPPRRSSPSVRFWQGLHEIPLDQVIITYSFSGKHRKINNLLITPRDINATIPEELGKNLTTNFGSG
jgi:hypothetical protein